MAADASWNGHGVIGSDDDVFEGEIVDTPLFSAEDVSPDDFDFFGDRPQAERSSLKSEKPGTVDRQAKGGIPNIDEWMGFFSRVLIRLSTDFYIDYAFRDVDEEELTDREIERIHLSDVERDRMARPFAEYSNKSKFMRKHGRMIIASADSIDAVIQMGMWFSRVNRIAAKYKGTRKARPPRVTPVRAAPIFRPEPRPQPPQQDIPDFEDRSNDVGSGQGTSENGHSRWRPDIAGTVFNPSGGG